MTTTAATDRWTNPTIDAAASDFERVLKASHWVTDPYPDHTAAGGEQVVVDGWAYAEVGCGDKPSVAFRVPTHDGWAYLSAADAVAVGALLIRMAGVAQTAIALDPDSDDHAVLRAVLDRLVGDGAETTDIEEETTGT